MIGRHGLPHDCYENAIANTYDWFLKNWQRYDPQKASILSFFNGRLRYRLLDERIQIYRERAIRKFPPLDEEGREIDLLDSIATPAGDVTLRDLVLTLELHKHELEKYRMKSRPKITAYRLTRHFLEENCTFRSIASRYSVSESALCQFWRRKCQPILQEILQDFR